MTSSLGKFYNQTRQIRLQTLLDHDHISQNAAEIFASNTVLEESVANALIENQISQFPIPMGVALNFVIDEKEVVIPMVVEEPSVIAACSYAAKLARPNGFYTKVHSRLLIGQIILKDVEDIDLAETIILDHTRQIIELANHAHPSIVKRGGGVKDIKCRALKHELGNFFTIHLMVDVQNAMGANIINTILEGVTPYILDLLKGSSLMSILSNYNTEALVTATCSIDVELLQKGALTGLEVAKKIEEASLYAQIDPYRAVTHNKGIMNGIESVVIATGNDPRAVSAAAHAYASRNGHYQGMTSWKVDNNQLIGELTLPIAVGTVGGAISVLPMAQENLNMMKIKSAQDLGRVIVAVGLAQNLAALKALVSEGIQKGHMSLHANSLAIQVGAVNDEIHQVASELIQSRHMNTATALDILHKIRSKKN